MKSIQLIAVIQIIIAAYMFSKTGNSDDQMRMMIIGILAVFTFIRVRGGESGLLGLWIKRKKLEQLAKIEELKTATSSAP